MKHLPILAIVLFLISCSPQESPETKAIRKYIEQNTDNPKTYEPLETVPAEFEDLYQLSDISGQLMNVENVEGRIYSLLEDMSTAFGNLLADSAKITISELLLVYEEGNLEKFRVVNIYLKGTSALLNEFEQLQAKVPTSDKQTFFEMIAQFEGSVNRLEIEVKRLFEIVEKEIGLSGYDELAAAFNSSELFFHKYRITENGAPVLKAALLLIKEAQVIGSLPVRVNSHL